MERLSLLASGRVNKGHRAIHVVASADSGGCIIKSFAANGSNESSHWRGAASGPEEEREGERVAWPSFYLANRPDRRRSHGCLVKWIGWRERKGEMDR